jgi:hypothetical protein
MRRVKLAVKQRREVVEFERFAALWLRKQNVVQRSAHGYQKLC